MKVSRITAMAMWRIQLKSFPWNSICWMARRTWGQGQGITLHAWSQDTYPVTAVCCSPSPLLQPYPCGLQVTVTPFPSQVLTPMPHWSLSPLHSLVSVALPLPHHPCLCPRSVLGTQNVLFPNPYLHHGLSFPSQRLVLKPPGIPVGPLTGKRTMGTVRVTAVSTATRTHRISTSKGSTLLYVCSSSDSTRSVNTIKEPLGEP